MENVLNKKVIKKDKVTIDENTLKLFSKETEKQYKILDNVGLYNALCERIPDEDFSIKQQIRDKFIYQGIIDYKNKKLKSYCYVIDMNTKYSPKVKLYYLDSGETEVCKISKRLFEVNPLEIGDIIYVGVFKKKFKMEKVCDDWIQNTNAYDTWIEKYIKK